MIIKTDYHYRHFNDTLINDDFNVMSSIVCIRMTYIIKNSIKLQVGWQQDNENAKGGEDFCNIVTYVSELRRNLLRHLKTIFTIKTM